jgi:hypothetical protein
MFIDFQRKVAFVHVPKTAGSSVREHLRKHTSNFADFWGILDGKDMAHISVQEASSFVSKEFLHSCLRFAVVRDPYARLISAFRYLRTDPSYGCAFNRIEDLLSNIDSFAMKVVHLRTQSSILMESGQLTVNRLLRYEYFGKEFAALCQQLELPVDFGWVNPSSQVPAPPLRENSQRIIRRFYAEDFENFHYQP